MTTTEMVSAADITPEEAQARVDHCHDLDQNIRAGLTVQRASLWDVAKDLHEFASVDGWRVLGCETLGEWLADPEITMTKSTFHRLVTTYEKLVVERRIPEAKIRQLDSSKVNIVLPAITAGTHTVDEALADAHSLTAPDLREKYRGQRQTPQVPSRNGSDVVEGTAKVVVEEIPHFDNPTEDAFNDMKDRAKKRKRNFNGYAKSVGGWKLIEGEDGTQLDHWLVPREDERSPDRQEIDAEVAAQEAPEKWARLRMELETAIASGAENPRVNAQIIKAGLEAFDLLYGSER